MHGMAKLSPHGLMRLKQDIGSAVFHCGGSGNEVTSKLQLLAEFSSSQPEDCHLCFLAAL